ncbi:uncharacterized protein LOC119639666 [Glossina fuscipes]|uniref:Uncharacterized protein LOC119639666 n=1 Tax=Glossina fuscipes TaxID=7396 RepID=A0A9C5ZF04_9MUSC|nr:uncharacterized protein LOC119639666 [Glossina fuscipes]
MLCSAAQTLTPTIVDIIFEDFSTTPFNSPVVSPEGKLRNVNRSPLFILREKPKKNYSREFREKAKLALLYDPTPERKASDRGSDDIEKKDTYNVNQNKLFLKFVKRQHLS